MTTKHNEKTPLVEGLNEAANPRKRPLVRRILLAGLALLLGIGIWGLAVPGSRSAVRSLVGQVRRMFGGPGNIAAPAQVPIEPPSATMLRDGTLTPKSKSPPEERKPLDPEAFKQALQKFPDYMRIKFYDAVRGAPHKARARELIAFGMALEQQYGETVLVPYARRIAAGSFAKRAPLAATYKRLVKDPKSLDPAALEAYFKALRAAKQDDILLGALFLTGQVQQHLAEYRRLAQATGDPWFMLIADVEQAEAERIRGEETAAERHLLGALEQCQQLKYHYRCVRIQLALAYFYRSMAQPQLADAEAHAQAGWELARNTGQWLIQSSFIRELGNIATLRGDAEMAKAYYWEVELRNPEDCKFQQQDHVAKAAAYLDANEFTRSQSELLAASRCGEPLPIRPLLVAAHLDRIHLPAMERKQLQADLNALRQQGRLIQGEQALVDYIEGMLLIRQDPEQGGQLLRSAIAIADQLPAWNVLARNVRRESYGELAFAAAQAKDYGVALEFVRKHWDPVPAQSCVLAVVRSYERTLVLAQTEKVGAPVQGVLEVLPATTHGASSLLGPDEQVIVPAELETMLGSCRHVAVLAPPIVHGQGELLHPSLAWSFRSERHRPGATGIGPRHTLIVTDVKPPATLKLPPLVAPALLLSALRAALNISNDGSNDPAMTILQGKAATPTRVLEEMASATEIVFQAHGLLQDDGSAVLALSPDPKGYYQLAAARIQRYRFDRSPIIALEGTHVSLVSRSIAEPWSLGSALVEAGGRAALAAGNAGKQPRSSVFLAEVMADIRRGQAPAAALRDVRMRWLEYAGNPWVKQIVLVE